MKIVITGGSRGIGRMLAEQLSRRHDVVIISKDPKSLEKAARQLGAEGHCADVGNYREVEKVFRKIKSLDALINCAGVLGPVGFLGDNDPADWENAIRVNLLGTVNCCKAALPNLSGRGVIINIAGGGSAHPRIYHTAYASSKAAVVRFTETLAKELEDRKMGIRVNVIAPGTHRTGIWQGEIYEKQSEWTEPGKLFSIVDFLLRNEKLNGRFIHIKDDKKILMSKMGPDMFTLRRIDGKEFRASK